MSQATTLDHRHGPRTLRAPVPLLATVAAVALLVMGAFWSSRQPSVAAQGAAAAPMAPPATAASTDTSVPPAGSVFRNQEVTEEERAPTF